jgi:hypothetical protein
MELAELCSLQQEITKKLQQLILRKKKRNENIQRVELQLNYYLRWSLRATSEVLIEENTITEKVLVINSSEVRSRSNKRNNTEWVHKTTTS